jgi:hypothetical protein
VSAVSSVVSTPARIGRGGAVDMAWLAVVFAAMLLYLFTVVPQFLTESQGGDYPYYVQIADAPFHNSVPSPWRYRLLNPWFASLLMSLGVTTDIAFLVLTCAAAFVSCVLLLRYLRLLSLSPATACLTTLLFAVSVGGFIPLRRYYGYTDALTNALTLAILILAFDRRYYATAAALGIGTLAKENTLLMLPFLLAVLARARATLGAIALVILAPLAVYTALRLIVPPDATGNPSMALTWDTQVEYWRTAMVHGLPRWILWAIAYSLGPVWLLTAVGARANWTFLRDHLPLLAPLVIPLLRTTDTERALMLCFPVAFPLAAYAIDSLPEPRLRRAAGVLAIACTWAAQLTFDWANPPRIGPATMKDVVFLLLCLVPLLPWLLARPNLRALNSTGAHSTSRP